MKSVFLIAIVAIVMFGVMLPDVLGTKYVNESPYEFSIDYPYGWQVDGIQEFDSAQDFIENGVVIYDKDDWTTMMNIYIIEDIIHQFSDEEEINLMNEIERDYCNDFTFNNDGMICYDFVLLSERNNSIVYEINGYRAITIFYAFTDVFSNSNYPGEYPRVGTTTTIYTENNIWIISSVSEEWIYDKHSDLILDTVASFKFKNDTMQKEDTVVQQSSPVVQQPTPQPTPSVEKYPSNYNKYCTPSSVSFDSTVSNSFLLKIGNPDSLSCKYGVSLYEMDRTKIKDLGSVTNIASIPIGTSIPEGNYMLSVKSTNGDYSKFFPLYVDHPNHVNPISNDKIAKSPATGVESTKPTPTTPVDPILILIVIVVVTVGIIAVALSKRKKSEPEESEQKKKSKPEPGPTDRIDAEKFVMACDLGDEDEFIRKFKSGKTEQECQKVFNRLVVDLMQQNADAIVIMFARTLIHGTPIEPTIPKRPDPPRLSNASTTTQPLRVIVNWTAPNDGGSKIISYDVYRSSTGKSKGFKIVERGIRGLTFMDTLPSAGTWYYDVIATNSIGASPPSLGASITIGSSGSGSSGSGSQAGMTEEKIQDYKTLKLSPGASQTEIKNAHRKIIAKYHPDKAKTDSERKKFTAITINANLAKERLMKK